MCLSVVIFQHEVLLGIAETDTALLKLFFGNNLLSGNLKVRIFQSIRFSWYLARRSYLNFEVYHEVCRPWGP